MKFRASEFLHFWGWGGQSFASRTSGEMSSRAPKCRAPLFPAWLLDAFLCINSFSLCRALAAEVKSEAGVSRAGWFLSLPIGMPRKFWPQPGENLGSAVLLENQERGEKDVACSHKGLLNPSGGMFWGWFFYYYYFYLPVLTRRTP